MMVGSGLRHRARVDLSSWATNRLFPGSHPNPSICRVGDEYFTANSSFEYVPGVPIHRSADLVTWELVGHALRDAEEIAAPEGAAGASSGVFAPTLRHHDGRFWLARPRPSGASGRGSSFAHAEHPDGRWLAPVRVPGTVGIDPDLAWDDEGRCLLTWRSMSPPGICQVEIDPATGEQFGWTRGCCGRAAGLLPRPRAPTSSGAGTGGIWSSPKEAQGWGTVFPSAPCPRSARTVPGASGQPDLLAPQHGSSGAGGRACGSREAAGRHMGDGVPRHPSKRLVSLVST